MFVLYFLSWTFVLYWVHRFGHIIPGISEIHGNHHEYVNMYNDKIGWHWSNIFLFNDTWMSTADLWTSEIIPTFIFCIITGQWWIFIFYYLWAAFIQERVEHNSAINLPIFTFGKWHMVHHRNGNKNYGLFFPIWDMLFGTYESII